uniref:WD repeat-containing protein LWD1-like n=1 Tax=Rhizophora mucronata TaxID=61149 RepID=A0A2P2NZT1_RHIMU
MEQTGSEVHGHNHHGQHQSGGAGHPFPDTAGGGIAEAPRQRQCNSLGPAQFLPYLHGWG